MLEVDDFDLMMDEMEDELMDMLECIDKQKRIDKEG